MQVSQLAGSRSFSLLGELCEIVEAHCANRRGTELGLAFIWVRAAGNELPLPVVTRALGTYEPKLHASFVETEGGECCLILSAAALLGALFDSRTTILERLPDLIQVVDNTTYLEERRDLAKQSDVTKAVIIQSLSQMKEEEFHEFFEELSVSAPDLRERFFKELRLRVDEAAVPLSSNSKKRSLSFPKPSKRGSSIR